MKAGIYLEKEQVEIRELPLPEVGDNDVLVQNLYSSIVLVKHFCNTLFDKYLSVTSFHWC